MYNKNVSMNKKLLLIFFILISFFFLRPPVRADELGDIEKKLDDLTRALQLSIAATTPLEKNLGKLEENLASIRKRTEVVEKEIDTKEKQVREGENLLILAEELLSQKVKQLYKASSQFSSGIFSLLSSDLSSSLRQFGYQRAVLTNDRDTIVKVVLYIKDLEKKKKDLESEKARLAKVKAETDVQAAFLQKEITGAKKYQGALSTQIAHLSARQQQLLAEKLGSLNLPTSLGAGPLFCTDDRKIDPGFSPAFAFFTFGIPHRVGMNQYGAYGRAKAGQNYQDILRAYYNGINFEKKDPNMKIKVQGHGEKNLDDYLLGIYEMPGDWPMAALKAQVIAARSYAISYTNNGANEICTTQACQVYKGGNKGGNWETAVKETSGEVITNNGEVVKAWYASTFGGYTFTSGDVWGGDRAFTKRMRDTSSDVNSFSDLFDRAYDKESPCFYAAQGWRSEYGKSAWIKADELADIVNTLLLAKKDSGVQQHLSQRDKPNPDGTDTWDSQRVKQELSSRGGSPYNSISSVSIDWDKGLGKTTSIRISGDGGDNTFDGGEFKNFFNLRAPANIQIVGPLYNIEKK